ncbi:hypothetical protein K1W54_11805 [Micromonospora sp. CPCC 205371]|nr:hypothetical protein [Micromonospora sp. CPCC 205371]
MCHAIKHGEQSADIDPVEVIRALGEPVNETVAEQVAAAAIAAAKAGAHRAR